MDRTPNCGYCDRALPDYRRQCLFPPIAPRCSKLLPTAKVKGSFLPASTLIPSVHQTRSPKKDRHKRAALSCPSFSFLSLQRALAELHPYRSSSTRSERRQDLQAPQAVEPSGSPLALQASCTWTPPS